MKYFNYCVELATVLVFIALLKKNDGQSVTLLLTVALIFIFASFVIKRLDRIERENLKVMQDLELSYLTDIRSRVKNNQEISDDLLSMSKSATESVDRRFEKINGHKRLSTLMIES